MPTLYTQNARLAKPSVADRNWNLPINANADALDALAPIGGLCVATAEAPSASLSVRVAPGRFQKADGTVAAFAGSPSTALAAGQTSSLYLDPAGALVVSTAGYPATAHVPLATVTAGATTVAGLVDDRVVCGVVGADARPFLPLAGGAMADGADLTLGAATGSRIGSAASQKLGFWGAAPVVRPGPYALNNPATARALAAYTSAPASAAFAGLASGQAGSPYAAAADLNGLRLAYENLRVSYENAAQVLAALLGDLKAMGLLG